ncbi:MAG: CHAT domain-containing protein [Myxococcota bacterium]
MRRFAVIVQIVLAAGLTMLWLRWNPLSSDCVEGNCDEGFDPFVDTVPEVLPEPPPITFAVQYGGCERIERGTAGPRCVYRPGSELRMWLDRPRIDDVAVSIDGAPAPLVLYGTEERIGQGLRISLPEGLAERLDLIVANSEPWTLQLRSSALPAEVSDERLGEFEKRGLALEKRLTLGKVEALNETKVLISDWIDAGRYSEAIRETLVASYHLVENCGRPDLAHDLIETQRERLPEFPWGTAATSIYRGHGLRDDGRLVEAAEAYRYGGRYALGVEDRGLQIDAFSNYARVLADLGYFRAASYWGNHVLSSAGETGVRPADLIGVMDTVAHANLRLRRAGRTYDDPARLFRQILELSERYGPDEDIGEFEPARLGLAEIALMDGAPGEALRWLDEADPTHFRPLDMVSMNDLRVRALLAKGGQSRGKIRATLRALDVARKRTQSPWAQWRAELTTGLVREHEADRRGAREAYARAEAILDRAIPLASLGVGREDHSVAHGESSQRLIALLLAEARPEEALCVARHVHRRTAQLTLLQTPADPTARARLDGQIERFRALETDYAATLGREAKRAGPAADTAPRESAVVRGQLDELALEILRSQGVEPSPSSCDHLVKRRPGELLLGLYPHLGGLLVVAQDDLATSYRVIANYGELARSRDWAWLGRLLLGPLDEELARAQRVRVLAHGEPSTIPVHALAVRGEPLGTQIPVVYGLELPPHEARASGAEHNALVLEDPGALGASEEADVVMEVLFGSGWFPKRGGTGPATAESLEEELGSVDLFHYAGHVVYDPVMPGRLGQASSASGRGSSELDFWPPYAGGAAARPSYIPLGEHGRLGVQRILMLEQTPRTAVLMGCETGVQGPASTHGGVSLAAAFLAAGTEAVVASTAKIDGNDGLLLARGLYAGSMGGSIRDPGAWFMAALRWARERGLSDESMGNFRLLVP